MTTEPPSNDLVIARFWARLGAFFVDGLILGAVGVVAGFFLEEQFVQLGPWGRLLGFAIALPYFGTLNSRLAGGQTLGKRLLKIKVVASDGTSLSAPRAFVRFLPLGVPWFVNNAQFCESVMLSAWMYVLSVAIFGIGLSVVYLYLFNRRSRQSLHDLIVGSYVVSSQATGAVTAPAPWRAHLAVCGVLILGAAAAPHFAKNLAVSEPFASLMDVYRQVSSQPWVVSAKVNKGQAYFSSSAKSEHTTTYLNITAYTRDPDVANAERAKQLARLALSTDNAAKALDVIQVTLVYGYDIGIASSWRSQNHAHSPAEWLAQ